MSVLSSCSGRHAGRVFEESLPDDLARAYRYLAALPPEVPVPLMVLQRMWASDSTEDAAETAHIFEMQGVLKTAQLADGTVWCLPSPQHLAQLRVRMPEVVVQGAGCMGAGCMVAGHHA